MNKKKGYQMGGEIRSEEAVAQAPPGAPGFVAAPKTSPALAPQQSQLIQTEQPAIQSVMTGDTGAFVPPSDTVSAWSSIKQGIKGFFDPKGAVAGMVTNPVLGFGVGVVGGIFDYIQAQEQKREAKRQFNEAMAEKKRQWNAEFKLANKKFGLTQKQFQENKRITAKIEQERARAQMMQVGQSRVNNILDMLNQNVNLKQATLNMIRGGA